MTDTTQTAGRPEIKVGQIWQEVDPRFPTLPHRVVQGFTPEGRVLLGYRSGTRTTKADPARFRGQRGGYRLIQDTQP